MAGIEEFLINWLTELSHHPVQLYFGIVIVLFASSFGLPLPEEVVLVTAGTVAYLALAEAAQTGGAPGVSAVTLASVCFFAVLFSDLLVFALGRRFGLRLLRVGPLKRFLSDQNLESVERWTRRHGPWACGIFRFTPGLRFPGHFMCGAMGITYTRFLTVDGLAALLSVPTQVLLIAYYGDEILVYFKTFKFTILSALIVGFGVWFFMKRRKKGTELAKKIDSPSATT